MAFNAELPEWNKTAAAPPQTNKDNGWAAEDYPPASWFNWFFNVTYLALQELQQEAAPIDTAQMAKLTKDDGYVDDTISGTDLNNLLKTGFYYGNNLINAPGGTAFHRITVFSASVTSLIQEATTNGGDKYIRSLSSGVWGRWVFQLNDNTPTWTTLTLQNGAQVYTPGADPQFCKIGKVVYIQGAVKNITAPITIATLPVGFRPNRMTHAFSQASSLDANNVATVARYEITPDGQIKYEGKSGSAPVATTWFPIHTSFVID